MSGRITPVVAGEIEEMIVATIENDAFHEGAMSDPRIARDIQGVRDLFTDWRRLRTLIEKTSEGVEAGFMCALPPNDVSGQSMWQAGQEARRELYDEAEAIRKEQQPPSNADADSDPQGS